MIDMHVRRRLFAEEIEAIANVRTAAVLEGLATIPREQFLRPGPWTIRSEADFGGPPRQTPDADPRHLYHNIVVGIDPIRQLFNGSPALLARAIDLLSVKPGARVLHLGAGLGYYTAIIGHCTGASGHVVAIEVDETLAREARDNLSSMPWVEVRTGDGRDLGGESFDAILVSAGVTHPLDGWLDALTPGGHMIVPITATMAAMGPTIGKGIMLLVTRNEETSSLELRPLMFVAIYSAIGVRDEALNALLGQALARNPFPQLKRLRRDPHEVDDSCWLHRPGCCLALT